MVNDEIETKYKKYYQTEYGERMKATLA